MDNKKKRKRKEEKDGGGREEVEEEEGTAKEEIGWAEGKDIYTEGGIFRRGKKKRY